MATRHDSCAIAQAADSAAVPAAILILGTLLLLISP